MQELALYLDYRLDESYTPKQISIRAGNSFTDMTEVHSQELDEPSGWTRIPLKTLNSLQGEPQTPSASASTLLNQILIQTGAEGACQCPLATEDCVASSGHWPFH